MPDKRIKTKYGFKKLGNSPFVFIAPHAAGDDSKTGIIANKLAQKTAGFLIVNQFYFKPTNSKAARKPDYIEDFNKLSWSNKYSKYLWKRKKPAMKLFFSDVEDYCDQAKKYNRDNQAIAIYIHGMNDDKMGIDIGVGVKLLQRNNKFIGNNRNSPYSGILTVRIKQLKILKKILDDKIKKSYNLTVGIGERFPAWGKRIAVQFHKNNRNDYAIQLEINKEIKKNDKDIDKIVGILNDSLKETFK